MRGRFAYQPFVDGSDLRDFLEAALREESISRLLVVVAWAKRSGLRLFEDLVAEFHARGGESLAIIGVSEGGATRQGLELALKMFDEVWVVHDVSGRTFHPKVYVATGNERALVLVGSHNLTRGGAFSNFEAGVVLELDPADTEDSAFLGQVDRFVEKLAEDGNTTVKLSSEMLSRMLRDSTLRIGDEDARRDRGDDDEGDSDSVGGGEGALGEAGIFRRSTVPRRAPPSMRRRISHSSPPSPPGGSGAHRAAAPASPAPGTRTPEARARVSRRWTKQLSKADAQRPNAGTNPTGHLSLVQAGHGIDQTTYFRNEFFGGASWKPVPGGREETHVPFEVFVAGTHVGKYQLRIRHTPGFEAGQGNRTTVLHWGELAETLRAQNFIDDYVSLERLDESGYRLTIDRAPTGPFLR